jgi:hypothetical protein
LKRRQVTDAHYHIGVVVRSQRDLNKFLADGLRDMFRQIISFPFLVSVHAIFLPDIFYGVLAASTRLD